MSTKWKVLLNKAGNPNGSLVTPLFRGAYAHLFVATGFRGEPEDKKTYSISMLFPKGTDFEPLKKLIMEVATEKWGAKAEDILRKQSNSDKRIFKNQGDNSDAEGFEDGCIYLSARNKKKPGVVGTKSGPDGTLVEITQAQADEQDIAKSGDYFIASIRPFGWEHPTGGKGISLSLNNVQLIKVGERLGGGRTRPNDDFEAYDDDDVEGEATSPEPKGAKADPFN